MRLSTASLARAAGARPRPFVAAWVILVIAGFFSIATLLDGALASERTLRGSEYQRGQQLLEEKFPESQNANEVVVVRSETTTTDDPAFRGVVESLTNQINATGDATAVNLYENPDAVLVAPDKRATTIPVRLRGANEDDKESAAGKVVDIVTAADGDAGLDVTVTGEFTMDHDRAELSQDDLRKGELFFGLPVALLVLVFVFGALGGAAVPLLMAIVSIIIGLGIVAVTGQIGQYNLFIVNMLTGMGLALGIDYSLFVVTRYREERARGREKLDAITAAGATSSQAVLISGGVFVLALIGMLLVPDTVLRSLAFGAIFVGIVSVLAALTLLPALLGLLGDRVNSLRLPVVGRAAGGAAEGRFWGRVARAVMRRPVASLLAAAALLLALSVPVLDLTIRDTGLAGFPDRLPSKQGFLALQEAFPRAAAQPAQVVVNGNVRSEPVRAAVTQLEQSLTGGDEFGSPSFEANPAGDLGVLSVPIAGNELGDRAISAVRELRDTLVPDAFSQVEAEVVVTGATAEALDGGDIASYWLPIVIAFILALSFVTLTIAFRSIVVPLKAIVLNLLSVGAAYGLIVLVFEKGYAAGLLGFQKVETVESWVPPFLFSVLFALSMDYHVFLISRIRERFGQTRDNNEAVQYGVSSSARLITGAALIMIAVFTGFAIGDLVMFQQMGFGLAVALLIDATIVRSVLLPASMKLLGERNWYLPSWLEWLPRLEAGEAPETPAPSPSA